MIIGIVSIAGIWFNLTAEIARLERDLNLVQNKLDITFDEGYSAKEVQKLWQN